AKSTASLRRLAGKVCQFGTINEDCHRLNVENHFYLIDRILTHVDDIRLPSRDHGVPLAIDLAINVVTPVQMERQNIEILVVNGPKYDSRRAFACHLFGLRRKFDVGAYRTRFENLWKIFSESSGVRLGLNHQISILDERRLACLAPTGVGRFEIVEKGEPR